MVGTRALRRQVASAPGRARQRTGIDAAPLVSGRRDDVERMLSQEKYLSVLNMHQQDGWTGRLKVAVKENSGKQAVTQASRAHALTACSTARGLTSRLSPSMPLCGELGL